MNTHADEIQMSASSGSAPKYGKYRGKVTSSKDPLIRGRIQITVANVISDPQWAEACVPYAGDLTGMLFLPKDNDDVWITGIVHGASNWNPE